MAKGQIVAGAIAPHPPHLVYAENPPQNEPRAECGWETLRWGYESLRRAIPKDSYDVIVVHSPHWRTFVGTHILALDHAKSLSVDPIFPNLFRFHYDMKGHPELARKIYSEAQSEGLTVKLMTEPQFRVDYGTVVSCHLINPDWDRPIVTLSSQDLAHYFSVEVMQETQGKLAKATKRAIEDMGLRVLLVASHSLSHRHFTTESEVPEDMSREHIYNHNQYLWDMKLISLFKEGKTKAVYDLMPDFTQQATAETDSGSLSWLLQTMDFPTFPAQVHAYGTVIGTGNAVVSWDFTKRGGVQ
jgi:2-aminophenol/2-amino-5-chlorophenol 1,6-dioxygenase beta subunit